MNDTSKYAQHAHRKDLTFRQAEGIDPLPKMLAYGELDDQLRNGIWKVVYSYFSERIKVSVTGYDGSSFDSYGSKTAKSVAHKIFNLPFDEADTLAREPDKFMERLKRLILKGNYADILELVQQALRSSLWRPWVRDELVKVFEAPVSPYIVVNFPSLTIVPRDSEYAGEVFKDSWVDIKASPLEGAKTHLRQSAEALNRGDNIGAFREAIHAVESAVKVITGKPSADLAAGLKVLGGQKGLHKALKDGFTKLYSYASDEKGVRHALIDADNANVGRDEALYFFSACTAFVAYLARKFPEKV